jgi:hypothetical protein
MKSMAHIRCGSADPFRQPPFGPAWQIELHGTIDTQDALVVPAAVPLAQPVEALPEPPAAVPADNLVESPDDLGVPVVGDRLFFIGSVR